MEREWSPRDAQKRTIFAVHQKRKAGHPELVFGICESSISYLFLVGDKKEYGIIGNKKETNDEADSKTKRVGRIQQKILLFAYWGLTLCLTRSSRQYLRVVKAMHAEWQEIDRKALGQSVNSMERSGMVRAVRGKHGVYTSLCPTRGGVVP